MFAYVARRIVYVIPIVISVALVCFLLVHITPGDPLVAILPADASQELANQLRVAYGFDRPLPVQFGLWLWKAVNGDLGHSIATGRPVLSEVMRAVGNTVTLAIAAARDVLVAYVQQPAFNPRDDLRTEIEKPV